MRITLSSSALSDHLSTLSRVINSKNSISILDCFLFEVAGGQLTITASDSENMMRTTLALDSSDGDGRFAVNSQKIFNAVKELPEQPITLDVDAATSSVKAIYQNGMYNFAMMNANEYPIIPQMTDDITSLKLPNDVLAGCIARTVFATAQEELRQVMNGVYFDFTPEALVVVASDGHKLVRNKYYGVKTDAPKSFILPKKPANLLKNILGKDSEDVSISFNSRNAEIRFSDIVLQCILIEGKYPNYNSVIPTDNPYHISIDRKSLMGTLRRVLPFASESSQLVRLHVENGKLEISSEDTDFSTSAKEEVTCDYSGNTMNIGFKGSSLIETLGNLSGETVTIELADPSRPCIIYPNEQAEGLDVLMLLMPMLLNDY